MNSVTTSSPAQPAAETSWLTKALPVATFVVGVATTLVLGGVDYGHQKNALENQTARVAELQKANDELRKYLDQWREAYTQKDAALLQAQNKLTAMQNDQCEAIRVDISNMQYRIENTYGYSDSQEKRSNLQIMMQEQQESLQACFAARK